MKPLKRNPASIFSSARPKTLHRARPISSGLLDNHHARDSFLASISARLDLTPFCCLVTFEDSIKGRPAVVKAVPLRLDPASAAASLHAPLSIDDALGRTTKWEHCVIALELFETTVSPHPFDASIKFVDGELCPRDALFALGGGGRGREGTTAECRGCPHAIPVDTLPPAPFQPLACLFSSAPAALAPLLPPISLAAPPPALLCSLKPPKALHRTRLQRFLLAVKARDGPITHFLLERPFGAVKLVQELPPPTRRPFKAVLGPVLRRAVEDRLLGMIYP